MSFGPGLVGETKGRWDRVLKTTGDTVRAKNPRRPLKRCDWMEVSLVLIFSCTRQIVR